MFSRRHASPVQPLTKETANANAATAAASAFMRRASDASLSSAAAAAALRARPTSPTNVADVQSKRLSRRSPSVSSVTGKRRELTRTPSVGSMRERTFRSPSPGRSPAPVSHDVPPIPHIPKNDNYKASPRPTSSSRKGPQTQSFRTASERMRDGQGSSWFGAAAAHDLHTVRRTASELQLSSMRAPPDPRSGSVSPSINFSYPRARLRSPSGSLRSLQPEDQALVYDPNSRRMVPRAQVEVQSEDLYDKHYDRVVEKQQPKKRPPKAPKEPKPAHISRAGSHLSRGTVARTKAPALDNINGAELQTPSSTIPELDSGQKIDRVDPAPPKLKTKKKKTRKQLQSSVAPESMLEEGSGKSVPENKIAEKPHATTESSAAVRSSTEQKSTPSSANGTTSSPHWASKVKAVAREASESPARSARFAASATDQLVVRHEPPPRSLSPRKSALKHASPTRTVSPSDDSSDVSGVPGSLASPDDVRKKSFRVSWDDRHTVVVGEHSMQHAVEQTPSPNQHAKKAWHSIVGKGSKKDAISVGKEETMSPRPTLPSFGSVREKKPKEQEERRLVRPEHTTQAEICLTAAAALMSSHLEPSTPKSRDPVMNVCSSMDKDEKYSSSEDGLLEDTSDEDLDSGVEAIENGATRKINGSSGTQVPTIAVSDASPHPSQSEQLEKMAPINAADDDGCSSESEELETIDPHLHGTGQLMDDIKEEEEADMYSDAYEEIAEPDGGGFLSLDAVLESPTSSPNSNLTGSKPAAETGETPAAGSINQSQPPDEWENAKAYWKSLSSEKRRQLEREAIKETEEGHQEDAKTVTVDAPKTTQPTAELKPTQERSYQIPPGTIQPCDDTHETSPADQESKINGTTMRNSMRGGQPSSPPKSEARNPGGSLRKSMRSGHLISAGAESAAELLAEPMNYPASPRMKRSLRHSSMDLTSSESRPSYNAADRPVSYHAAVDSASSTRHTSSLRASGSTAAAQGAGIKATLRRRGSDSSESSFTRVRAGSGTHEFRRSMRGNLRQPLATSDEMRPLSPSTIGTRRDSISSIPSRPGFGGGRLRQSLRGQSADPPARRRIPGFGKSTSTKSKKGKNDSRFGDSSDEDEGPPHLNLFKSRFADSSSEDDEPHAKSQGKNIPRSLRAKSDARATDLPFAYDGRESHILDAAILMQPKRTQAATGQPGSGRGTLVPLLQTDDNGKSFRPQHTRRGSFISLLRRKKDPASKVTRNLSESAIRQDTKLERSPEELEALRNTSLHKRGPSWPLPEPEATSARSDQLSPERPSTAGGAIVSTSSSRSKFIRQRSASHSMVPADTVDIVDHLVTDAMRQKKKKFGALRKMFRLHD